MAAVYTAALDLLLPEVTLNRTKGFRDILLGLTVIRQYEE
jgi:membrane protein CcdC involved in cytochrome C biogenesis